MTVVDEQKINERVVRSIQHDVALSLGRESRARETAQQPPLTGDDERQYALALIAERVREHVRDVILNGGEVPPQRHYEERLGEAVFSRMYLAGVLQTLLDDPEVENIDINGCDQVWVSRAGAADPELHPEPLWTSDAEMIGTIQVLGAHAGLSSRPWTRANPLLDLRLADGSRLAATMGASARPTVSIRRSRFDRLTLPELVALGTASRQVATFLQAGVSGGYNFLLTGATNSGKTSLLRAMLSVLPPKERLIVIEIAQELCLWKHPDVHANVVEMEEQPPDPDGKGGLSMAQLVRRTLRMNPSRVIVGEVLGDEIIALLNVMSQGNGGSLGTIHAHSSEMAIDRVAMYAAQAAQRQDFDVTHAMVGGAVDFIVHMHRDRDTGRRTVQEIREITGFNGTRATSHLIFSAPRPGMTALPALKISDRRLELLAHYGYNSLADWAAVG